MSPSFLCRPLVLVLVALIPLPSAYAADVHTRVELENSRMKLIFLRGKKKATDPVGGIGMTQIIDKLTATEASFNTLFSSMFQVELRSTDPVNFPTVKIPDGEVEFVLLPIEQTILESINGNTARMSWLNIDVPGSSQTLNACVTCKLRTDGMAEWNFDMQLTSGPYWIYAVRCPYLGFKAIEDDSTDDSFFLPMTGGQVIPDPLTNGNSFPERDAQEGRVADAFFTYPGNMMSQFMAYYDDAMGLYLTADDLVGTTKNLYFNVGAPQQSPEKIRLYSYYTHFNEGLNPAGGESTATIEQDLRTFNLNLDLGYNVLLDVFTGDWLDAAERYKDFVVTNDAPFLIRGTLSDRIDVDEATKTTTYVIRWGLPIDADAIDPNDQFNKIQQTLQFLNLVRRRYDPAETIDFLPFILMGSYHLGPDGPTTMGHDDISYPIREGVPELLDRLRFDPLPASIRARSISMNRDTTGIATDAAIVGEGLEKGIMYQPDLSPMLAKDDRYRSCVASSWLRQRRTDLLMQTMADSQIVPGVGGFNAIATTGTGNFSFVCFAPLVDDPLVVDRTCHRHRVGGGLYQTAGWVQLASQVRAASALQGNSPILLGMEHTPETMIRDYILAGRSFAEPLDESLEGVFRTIDNAIPVPLFGHLYHHYAFQPSKPPSVTKAIDLYVDEDHPLEDLLILRLRYAQIAMHGRMLRAQIDQSDPNNASIEGPVQGLDPALQDEQVLLAALSLLRGSAPKFFVFGERLRNPELQGVSPSDSVSMRFKLFTVETTVDVLRVVASAWRGPTNGDIGICLVNFTPNTAFVNFTIDPVEYGLDPAGTYAIEERVDISTWVDTGFTLDPTQPFVSPNLRVDPLENGNQDPPWRLIRIRDVTP